MYNDIFEKVQYNENDFFEQITEEEYDALKEYGDPSDAPSNHYAMQPYVEGKLLWVSGAPGLGKSTIGLLLSRTAGYVYYEGDTFRQHLNPYIPPDVEEPSLATVKQIPLKDVPKERIDAVNNGTLDFDRLVKGEEYNIKNVESYYTWLCKDIKKEKKRIGGNWVVASAVPTRHLRDHIKNELGNGVIFIVLNMAKEDQMKRLLSRHGNEESGLAKVLNNMFDKFEPATENEDNALDCVITSGMTREDVIEKIFKMVQ